MKMLTLDAATSVLDVAISALDGAISALDGVIPELSVARRGNIGAQCCDISTRCRVSGDIGDCGVGLTTQMCNRVTNP